MGGVSALTNELAQLRRRIAHGDLLHGAHLVLAALFVVWTAIERTPSLASSSGATWISTPLGRGATFVTELGAVVALGCVAWQTWRERSSWRAWLLALALGLSIAWRKELDVFDLVYVASALVLGLWWFREDRPKLAERALEL